MTNPYRNIILNALDEFARSAPAFRFPAGAVVIDKLTPKVGYIVEGLLREQDTSAFNKKRPATVSLRGKPQWFGFGGLLSERYRGSPFHVEAVEPSLVALFDYDWVFEQMPQDMRMAAMFQYCYEVGHWTSLHCSHRHGIKVRLLRTLMYIKSSCNIEGDISITMQDIADLAGTTKSNVSRILYQFEQDGLMEKSYKRYLIYDYDTLIKKFRASLS